MVNNVADEFVARPQVVESLRNESELPLYGDMLHEGNTLPNRTYQAKKGMCPMGIEYKKIHACPNDCILYRNAHSDLTECPVCKPSRYKLNKGPTNTSKGTTAKIRTFDAARQEYFNMRAMQMCTINDFPAYGNLSGYIIKGYKARPICEEATHSRYLKNCRKMVYMGHRHFLPRHHPYRR
ncbi:hypothetical protein QQ045_001871 [Rhodiola kirilowii]